jgi:hypothetical protein
MGIDGSWCRGCLIVDISKTGAKIVVQAQRQDWGASSFASSRVRAISPLTVRVGADQLGHVPDRYGLGLDPAALGGHGGAFRLQPVRSLASAARPCAGLRWL